MTIKDLKNGDIILQREGHIGMVFEKNGETYILYPNSGYDELDGVYNDDLTDAIDGTRFDIMRVYRYEHGMIGFNDYEDGELIFDRDPTWVKPEV